MSPRFRRRCVPAVRGANSKVKTVCLVRAVEAASFPEEVVHRISSNVTLNLSYEELQRASGPSPYATKGVTTQHPIDSFGFHRRDKNTPRDAPRRTSTASRPGAGEVFRVQEMSDCDEDGLESVLSTSSPPAVTAAAAATVAAVNMGHQRASLELRNLALEREVSVCRRAMRRAVIGLCNSSR